MDWPAAHAQLLEDWQTYRARLRRLAEEGLVPREAIEPVLELTRPRISTLESLAEEDSREAETRSTRELRLGIVGGPRPMGRCMLSARAGGGATTRPGTHTSTTTAKRKLNKALEALAKIGYKSAVHRDKKRIMVQITQIRRNTKEKLKQDNPEPFPQLAT